MLLRTSHTTHAEQHGDLQSYSSINGIISRTLGWVTLLVVRVQRTAVVVAGHFGQDSARCCCIPSGKQHARNNAATCHLIIPFHERGALSVECQKCQHIFPVQQAVVSFDSFFLCFLCFFRFSLS